MFLYWSILLLADLREINHKHVHGKGKKKKRTRETFRTALKWQCEIIERTVVMGQDTTATSREKSEALTALRFREVTQRRRTEQQGEQQRRINEKVPNGAKLHFFTAFFFLRGLSEDLGNVQKQ